MSQTFAVGEYVKYGGTGICRIDRIEEIAYPGLPAARACYVLKPLRNLAVEVSVPLDNPALCEKIRPLLTKQQVDELLSEVRHAETFPWIEDRKQRGQEFRRMIGSGDTRTLLLLVHTILEHKAQCSKSSKRISTADDNARRDAERLLDDEFAFSLGISPEEAGKYIRARLAAD